MHRKRPRLREAPAVPTSPLLAGTAPALTAPRAGAGRSVLHTSRDGATLGTIGGRKAPDAPATRGVRRRAGVGTDSGADGDLPLPTGDGSGPPAPGRDGGGPARSAPGAGG